MRPNVKQFVQLLSEAIAVPRPIVDVGALRTEGQEDYADLRPFFDVGSAGGGRGYTGWDMRAGPGVDALGSVHHLPLAAGRTGTVLMLDTLEHVLDPIASMREACDAVAPGGMIVITSHMNFPIHAHPSDYWRFTPMTFDHLLRRFPARAVYTQGDSENPHNVIGVAMRDDGAGGAALLFESTLIMLESCWPDDSYGGPLLRYRSLAVDLSRRDVDGNTPEIIAGIRIEQTFVSASDGMARVDVKMANPAGPILRHVVVRIKDGGGHEIAVRRMLGWHVPDDGWLAVPVPEERDSAGKTYTIVIESTDGVPGQAVFAKMSSAASFAGESLAIDGVAVRGSLCFQTYRAAPETMPGDVQRDELASAHEGRGTASSHAAAASTPATAISAALAHLERQHTAQLQQVTATIEAAFDGLRQQAHEHHVEMLAMQERTLNATAEKLLGRIVRENAATRAMRRLRGGKRPDGTDG